MFSWLPGATDTTDSYSHSLRGAAMLLSVEEVLLAAVLGLWPCAAWPVFWLWAGWFWPAWLWLWLWAGFCVWLGLVGGLEASMLLPMLLPSCSRLMCRTTAVALNACWWEGENEEMEKQTNRKLKTEKQRALTLPQFLCLIKATGVRIPVKQHFNSMLFILYYVSGWDRISYLWHNGEGWFKSVN